MFDQNSLEAMLACFGILPFGPTWEEALCMVQKCAGSDVYVLKAMLACFVMFGFGPTWEEALCMFGKNVLEVMLARLRSKSDAGMFWHVSLWPNMGRGLVHVW